MMRGKTSWSGWRSALAVAVALAGLVALPAISGAQDAPAAQAPAAPSATPTPPANPPDAATNPSAPASPAPPASTAPPPAASDTTGASPGDASISQTIDVPARPAVGISGTATWDDGFKTLQGAFVKLSDALAKNAITPTGKPLTVFTATDDRGFSYTAMLPIAEAPAGKTELTPEVKVTETPSGKAIRFQHRASYDDIDSTYEAITAYLDEKGLEARNLFAEEYLNTTKTSDDPALQVDIYVFLK